LEIVENVLAAELSEMGYATNLVKVSELFRTIGGAFGALPSRESEESAADERYRRYMDAGDALRRIVKRNDAALFPVLQHIADQREALRGQGAPATTADGLLSGCAWIINSLKTPEEVLLLRRVYGPRFICIAAHAPRDLRLDSLATTIAQSRHRSRTEASKADAEELIFRDERGAETRPHGQNVADAFPLADMLIDATETLLIQDSLERLLEIEFSHPFLTPTRDEYGMYMAWGASLRSASLGRQVGAAIARPDGDVIALGVNEAARAGGGQYWPGDSPDGRDFQNTSGLDTGTRLRSTLLGNTLEVLLGAGWTPPATGQTVHSRAQLTADQDLRRRVASAQLQHLLDPDADETIRNLTRTLLIQNLIEFFREVHAEMSALADAARRGVEVAGSTIFCTAFPCHECARVLVAAGIQRVVFLEPYPKSLVQDLYRDSIVVDPPAHRNTAGESVCFETFVGVAPRRFSDFFFAPVPRKDRSGRISSWSKADAQPRMDIFGIPLGTSQLDAFIRNSEEKAVFGREAAALLDLDANYRSTLRENPWQPDWFKKEAQSGPRRSRKPTPAKRRSGRTRA
jgi:cytidine deaminase